MTVTPDVVIREVGLRDGLQLVAEQLSTERKIAWCGAAAEAGLREIEATSFVPPRIIPQFADAEEVARGALAVPGIAASALSVNVRGAERALDAGFRHLNYVISASEAHSQANARRSTEAAFEEFEKIVALVEARGLRDETRISCGIATAFGCTLQGEVAEHRVVELAGRLCDAGADEIMLADTVGYADPGQVGRLFRAIADLKTERAAHFHDTRGLGQANVVAALEAGVRRFDASLAGLGGCPFAPGATGNVATEDVAFLAESLGYSTGIDIEALLALREKVTAWLPGERFGGSLHRAGLPKTFHYARRAA